MRTIFAGVLLVCLLMASAMAQVASPSRAAVHERIEIGFSASEMAMDRAMVKIWVTFTHESGATEEYRGFWDGGDLWKVRFKPDKPGTWTWKTLANAGARSGLDGLEGSITVDDDPERRFQPRLQVAASKRTLETGDGRPFFWLGDTAWEITWKSRREQVEAYLDDRQEKGFTVIQIVVMSHQYFYQEGVTNRYGEPFFLGQIGRPNPRYFDYLDEIVGMANERGIWVALVPLWAYMMELHHIPEYHEFTLTREQGFLLADYIGARYAGHDVVWIVGGDNAYTTSAQLGFWNAWALRLKEASGGWHLMTVHPRGFNASFDYFDSDTPWLDFHMYQSSHVAGGNYTWQAAKRGWNLRPVKPVVNGEPNYEDIFHNLWEPGDTLHVETFRIRPAHVRQAAWESLLSGANMGLTYGGNGVWQWNTDEQPGSHSPRLTVEDAWKMPGSAQMGVVRAVAELVDWTSFQPADEVVLDADAPDRVPFVRGSKGLLGYVPEGTKNAMIDLYDVGPDAQYRWIDPRTGVAGDPQTLGEGALGWARFFAPPSDEDWLLHIWSDQATIQDSKRNIPTQFVVYPSFPNPFNPSARVVFSLSEADFVKVDVYSADGRHIRTILEGQRPKGMHTAVFNATGLGSGLYLARVQTSSGVGTVKMMYLK